MFNSRPCNWSSIVKYYMHKATNAKYQQPNQSIGPDTSKEPQKEEKKSQLIKIKINNSV
ncbi:hypothetical protein BMR1_02g02396 [Babesia microti strain RI]|uniref:Uncharacterized protein n=1 Tax=Babesia microti (strain RI) TaxID=1133968 RepID=A0A1R4AAK3_BABMR|nr:hypothetical protein BMR1_02g02396 [Babesia microti strain RI]SJK85994.1 hypothetical protein BMR1_02g02396 [Babesia microti strain RI]|eukprot:XP_021338193.1 hypothetical protein BMR1_02g02396 [Babesia microti strain RI]